MKENKLYNSIKLVVVTSFFVTWIALFMGSYFYDPIGIKYGLNMTTVLLWAYLQLYNFLVSKYERSEMYIQKKIISMSEIKKYWDWQILN